MKKIKYSLLITLLLFMTVGCFHKESNNQKTSINNNESTNSKEVIEYVKAIINEKEYIINLENNETAKSFANYLPQELQMSELNGNEKYIWIYHFH